MTRRIESFFLPGPAGRLEALLEEPGQGKPRAAALVLHPHPLGGGTMHNKVVYRMARALRQEGAVTLRFNFRGVHLSEGEHDDGRGEVDDARAARDFLVERYPGLPLVVAGFSFGSRIALRCWEGARRVIVAGFPTIYRQYSLLDQCPVLRVFVHSTNDEFGPRKQLELLYDRLWGPKRLHWVEARDHFFAGALDAFEKAIRSEGLPL
ncbi:MAG: alpha/beta hydrolase [Acidobacteriota bacterium]